MYGSAVTFFLHYADLLGIPIKASKTVWPTSIAGVHGIETDYDQMQARLPQEKILTLTQLLRSFSHCHSAQLIGSLSFACKVIPLGGLFIRRLIPAIQGVSKANHHVSAEVRRECAMWLHFLSLYNRVSSIHPWQAVSSLHYQTV